MLATFFLKSVSASIIANFSDTVKFADNDFRNQTLFNIPHQLLKLRTVCILAAVSFVCVFPATTAFQFVFAKLTLAFNGNAVLFVYDCIA